MNAVLQEYLTSQVPTYLGNKRALLPLITTAVEAVRSRFGTAPFRSLDLFSGSGVVSRLLKQCSDSLVVNDLEQYAEVLSHCYLANRSEVDIESLEEAVEFVDRAASDENREVGFFAKNYSPLNDENIQKGERVFFTHANGVYLARARQALEELDEPLRALVLGPLLYGASVHTNTSGVFKGFHKNRKGIGQFGGENRIALERITKPIRATMPVFSPREGEVVVCRERAESFSASVDLAYLDPPYNQHPYGSNYFILNLLTTYKQPEDVSRVSGIPSDWNRSPFNVKSTAAETLFGVIDRLDAPFVLLSYSNEGFISEKDFVGELGERGTLSVYSTDYRLYGGCRNYAHREQKSVTESLYLLERS